MTSDHVTRTEYLIDRHRVVYESGNGWHCECDEFKAARACRHTRESEGRRAAQAQIAARVRSVNGMLKSFAHHDAVKEPTVPRRVTLTNRRR